ncbi:MAG: S41 family peptidase [Phycisphaerales bacterium]
MKRTANFRTGTLLAALLATTSILIAPPPQPARAATPTIAAADLDALAEHGRFDELLTTLKGSDLGPGNDAVQNLIGDLERFKRNDAQRTQQRREAYDKAIAELQEQTDKDDLEKALIASVKAHGLADDPEALLNDPRITSLVNKTLAKADEAKQSDNWLEALALYRALDLLFETSNAYQDEVDQASRHIRVLQLYAPKRLQQLYNERAERRADPNDPERENTDLEIEDWQSRLTGVQEDMLRQTIRYASRKHVAQQDLAPLMQGAVDALIVMLDTRGLDESFAAFNDEQSVKQFRDYLARLSASLKEPGKTVSLIEASTIIDRVIKTNEETLKLPESVIVFEMTEGLTGSLDDFSSVIWPEERESFSRSTQGNFSGIGVQISKRDGRLIVVSPLENTPAMRAGLKAGDIIAQVEGKSTDTWSLNRAVQEITGPRGTQVNIGIERPGEPELLEYAITRDQIEIESIRGWSHKPEGGWDYWIDRDNGIGYIRLSQFIPQTADDLDAAIAQMQQDGQINGLILDLRFNPGGLLSSAIDICDRFIIEGPIVSTVDGDGNVSPPSRAHRLSTYPNFDMVVLINQGSASASEIVSGAMQDYHRATIIGTRSFGKGSVQDLFPLTRSGSAYLKLTTQYYMLPSKRIIHRKPNATTWGIEPDLLVDMTTNQIADALQLRQESDIIRAGNEPITAEVTRPWASETFRVPNAVPHTEGKNPDGTDREVVEINAPQPGLLLDLGIDSQLETALLVLKTRQASSHIQMAQADKGTGE